MRDSTPDEILGPISIKGLENDVCKRNTAGMLPEAEFAFLDEIFKGNSVVLNSTLTIMNERQFDNDGKRVDCPLVTLLAASNELPQEDELAALWDRFTVRLIVKKIADDNNFLKFLKSKTAPNANVNVQGNMADLKAEIEACKAVVIPDEVIEALCKIRRELANEKITPSDRRFSWMLRILQAEAFLSGRNTVELDDIVCLTDCVWDSEEARPKVFNILGSVSSPDYTRAVELWDGAIEAYNAVPSDCEDPKVLMEATMKLKQAAKSLKDLEKSTSSSKAKETIESALKGIQEKNTEMLRKIGLQI
jgi:MoxR-like ATPase